MGILPVVLAVVVALFAASTCTLPPPPPECGPLCYSGGQSQLSNLLQVLGISDTYPVPPLGGHSVPFLTEVRHLLKEVAQIINKTQNLPRRCKDLLDAGDGQNGVRVIHPFPGQPDRRLTVYCDQTTDGGGWTVFQRRTDSNVRENFNRTWREYQIGFGNIEEEFWLGLDPLHALTSTALQELRIDLADWEGNHRYARYGYFHVGGPKTKYLLSIDRYSGDAGDSLGKGNHPKSYFSTFDNDNDGAGVDNCAERHRGGWWHFTCQYLSSLNGYQYKGKTSSSGDGINWEHWRGFDYSLRQAAMMIRPAY